MADRTSPDHEFLIGDDTAWAERSEFWRTYSPPQRRTGPKKRCRYREPMILCGHGIRIRMDHNTLLIRNGFTHYPQKLEEIRFFPGDANLPDRIIILDGNGGISFDALNWLSDQKINLVQLNWRGEINNVGGGGVGYGGDPQLIGAQMKTKNSGRNSEIARWLIGEKIDASISTLRSAISNSSIRGDAISHLQKCRAEIRNARKSIALPQLLGAEGRAAAAYFRAWRGLPLKWSASKRKPIPVNWREIGPRAMGWRDNSRNARHPFNAMLNYGYGMLASQVRIQAVAAGLDLTKGIMHGNRNNRIPLVYDLMEPLRPIVDRQILEFVRTNMFTPGDFTINRWGGCRLNPQMAREVVREIPPFKEASHLVQQLVRHLEKIH